MEICHYDPVVDTYTLMNIAISGWTVSAAACRKPCECVRLMANHLVAEIIRVGMLLIFSNDKLQLFMCIQRLAGTSACSTHAQL
jgi:hypothetical protein